MTVSKILKDKTAEEIKFPEPTPFEVRGKTYPILPMPDGILVTVSKEIGAVASLLLTGAVKSQDRLQALQARQELGETIPEAERLAAGKFQFSDLTYSEMVDMLPQIIQVLLPSATKIIAASLRQTETWVEDTLFYRDRLRALRLILEAEEIALLEGEAAALVNLLSPTRSPEHAPTT